jgi:hypothetical protein
MKCPSLLSPACFIIQIKGGLRLNLKPRSNSKPISSLAFVVCRASDHFSPSNVEEPTDFCAFEERVSALDTQSQ